MGGFQLFYPQAGLRGRNEQRTLRRISENTPAALLLLQRRSVAQHDGRQKIAHPRREG